MGYAVVRRLLVVGSALLVVVAAVMVAYPLWWGHRQAMVGRRLEVRDSTGTVPIVCVQPSGGPGVLSIAATGVLAPVEQGLSESVLAVAVGHDPRSAWPGGTGVVVLEGHDVGYFSADASLVPGDTIRYTVGCWSYIYSVTGHEIARPGASLPAAGLVLVSCYPTDALWYTPDRYVVRAVLVRSGPSGASGGLQRKEDISGAPSLPPGVPPPPNLFDDGWLAGTLTVTGTPSPVWRSSPAPLSWVAAGVAAFAAYRQGIALSALAPGLPLDRAADGAYVGHSVDVSIDVTGTVVSSVIVDTVLSTGPVALRAVPRAGYLVVISISAR